MFSPPYLGPQHLRGSSGHNLLPHELYHPDEDTDSLEGHLGSCLVQPLLTPLPVQSVTEIVRDDLVEPSLERPTSAPPTLPSVLQNGLSFGPPLWSRPSAPPLYDWSGPSLQAVSISNPPSPSPHAKPPEWHPPTHHAHSHSLGSGSYSSFVQMPLTTRDSTPRSTPPLTDFEAHEGDDLDDEEKLVQRIDELQRRLIKMRAGKQQQQQHHTHVRNGSGNFAAPFQPKTVSAADAPLELFVGRFLELATEQSGCRFLQQRIALEGQQGAALVLQELLPQLNVLMVDAFGNYLYQILVQHVSAVQRADMLERVRVNLLRASLNIHGTRSVQKHIEFGGKSPKEREIIVGELGQHISKLAMDTNGNHCVQRMLQSLSHPDFIINAVITDLIVVTRHRHGCSVVQRCIDAANAQQRAALMDKILTNSVTLCQDPFANYVVQYVMDAGSQEERARLVNQIRGRILVLSKHKCSSNVVEKALVLAAASMPPVFADLVNEALPVMGDLLNDSFGNFVVQRLIETCRTEQQVMAVIQAVKPFLERINPATARRVADKILRRMPDLQKDRVIANAALLVIPQPPPPQQQQNNFRPQMQQAGGNNGNHNIRR